MELELRSLIKDRSELPSTNVNWGLLPTNSTYPAITMHIIGEDGNQTNKGPSSLGERVVQIDIWSKAFVDILILRDKVLQLDCYTNDEGIKGIFLSRSRQSEDTTDPNRPLYRYSLDMRILFDK